MQGYRGTRDFLPNDWRIQQYLFKVWRETSESYGFEEYEAPIIEPVELYIKKSGEEIKEQLFWFTDKGGREVCLRPELTQQLARYITQYGKSLKKPLKWFSIPRLFRYERPQKGRYREFFQYNADIISSTIEGTAEMINLCVDIMKQFGLKSTDFSIKINDRSIINELIERFNIKEPNNFYSLLDKRYKLKPKVFETELKKINDNKDLIRILKLKNADCLAKLKQLGFNTDRTDKVLSSCDQKFIEFDLSIVRGLDYYTGIVWEAYDREGKYRSLMGGGEYENLISVFGGPDTPCVGVGISDGVLPIILADKGLLPNFKKDGSFIAVIGDLFKPANKIARQLRSKGLSVYVNNNGMSVGKQLSLASSLGYNKAIIIGERDLKEGKVTIKDLVSGKERKVDAKNL
jgi:histidyl-tRNA synthetase